MSGPWIAAFLILWGVVILVCVLLLGILRRVASALEELEPHLQQGRQSDMDGLALGAHPQPFRVVDLSGIAVTSRELFDGGSIVLFLRSWCQPCQGIVRQLADQADLEVGVPILAFVDEPTFAASMPPAVRILVEDPPEEASRAFRASAFPQAFAVNGMGRVVAKAFLTSADDVARLARTLKKGGKRQVEIGVRDAK